MEDAIDALQFFSNSVNRVLIFEALSEGITTSGALAEQTEASRSTVARTLDAGESRGWVSSEGSQYELTTEGAIMFEEVRACLQAIEGIQHLGEAITWLPEPVHSLDYRYFHDAEIIKGHPSNPTKPFDWVSEQIRTADEIRTLAWTGVPRLTALINEQAIAEELDCEAVIQAGFFETLSERPEVISDWRNPAQRDEVWSYPGDVPISFHIIDEAVVIWLDEQQGEEEVVVQGALVTENQSVLSWAESVYDKYRAKSELLDAATLAET